MSVTNHSASVHVGLAADGSRTYLVDLPPDELPAVRGRDIERAWYAAREAALGSAWGAGRGFRFRRADGSTTDLALADRDALCWARAVDGTVGMGSCYGLSLCLRLLALVELLARAPWTAPFCRLARDGAELDPSLLRAAATTPLTEDARFDEAVFRARIAPLALEPPPVAVRPAGTAQA
jgi:hypothetical protein